MNLQLNKYHISALILTVRHISDIINYKGDIMSNVEFCPFCGEKLAYENADYVCDNVNCQEYSTVFTENVLLHLKDYKQTKEKLEKQTQALISIMNIRDNIEDYYGGVSVDYCRMVHDMENIAELALKEQGIVE